MALCSLERIPQVKGPMSTTRSSLTQVALDPASKSNVEIAVQDAQHRADQQLDSSSKGLRFWMVVLAICVSTFLSALEFTSVATALPTITFDLNGGDFVWVASAYALASTALIPASGGMAEIFGRRLTMLFSLALFALGSALCGAAKSMNWLIAARTVQGAGGGGILSLGGIILSDLVSLRERGTYNALLGLTWACAAATGPLVGGSLANEGQWRWLFYLNLPICGVAGILVLAFLQLRTPEGSLKEKLSRMDWIGNGLIITSSSATVLALTWGGVRYSWSSAHVLAPLLLGFFGMGIFLFYEAKFAKEPLVPFTLLSNRTSLSGYVQTFINPLIMLCVVYFMPIYFQACKGASPTRSGVDLLGITLSIGPVLIITGLSVKKLKSYRQQLWIGWTTLIIAIGTFSLLHANTPLGHAVGLSVLVALGSGMIYPTTFFPVLAPLSISENAHALAFFAFCRSFAAVWGVTIGTAVLQTQLGKRLPPEFTSHFPAGVSVAYSVIPLVRTLPEPARSQVREAFADSMVVMWQVMTGITGIGLLSSLFMKALPLHTEVDERWGLEEPKPSTEISERKATDV